MRPGRHPMSRPSGLGELLGATRRTETRAEQTARRRAARRNERARRAGIIERGARPPRAFHRRLYPICEIVGRERCLFLAVLLTLCTSSSWGAASLAWIGAWTGAFLYVLVCANPDGGRLPGDPAPPVRIPVVTRAKGTLQDVLNRRRP